MKKVDLGQLVAITANIGVIASLVFLAVQVRQDAEATRASTFQQLKDSWVQLNLAEATSVDLANAFATAQEKGWEDAGEVAQILITGHYRTLFHNWSNAYYHYENGTLDDNQWEAYVREIGAAVSNPRILRVWSEWNHVYDDHFRELMNEFISGSSQIEQPPH